MALTKKQETFSIEYVKSGNASAAYRLAYDAENMSNESINVKSSELLKNGKVGLRVKELQEQAAKIAKKKFDFDVEALQRTLLNWLNADITETLVLSAEEIKELPKDVRKLITSYKHTSGKYGETVELKFVSKEKAAEMLAKNIGFYGTHNEQKNDIKGYTIYDPTEEK